MKNTQKIIDFVSNFNISTSSDPNSFQNYILKSGSVLIQDGALIMFTELEIWMAAKTEVQTVSTFKQ